MPSRLQACRRVAGRPAPGSFGCCDQIFMHSCNRGSKPGQESDPYAPDVGALRMHSHMTISAISPAAGLAKVRAVSVCRGHRSPHAASKIVVCNSDNKDTTRFQPSRRGFALYSCNLAVLAAASLNQSDGRTIVNSLLGTHYTELRA